MVPFACMASPIPRQDRWKLVRSYDSINFGLPRNRGGSAPALVVSRPAQRLLTLRPACLPSRLCDLLHQRLQQSRCLPCCSDCYRVERTSPGGLLPLWTTAFHDAPGKPTSQELGLDFSSADTQCGLISFWAVMKRSLLSVLLGLVMSSAIHAQVSTGNQRIVIDGVDLQGAVHLPERVERQLVSNLLHS